MSDGRKASTEDHVDPRRLAALDQAQRLGKEGRFLEAATALSEVIPSSGDDLAEADHETARQAVLFFARGGDPRAASQILVRLPVALALVTAGATGPAVGLAAAALAESGGRPELAFRLRSWLGHHAEAARLARQLGRHADAGELFLRARLLVPASESFRRGGDRQRAIEALLGIEKSDPAYRSASVAAIRLAHEEGDISFALDRFLAPFTGGPSHNADELDALTLLANLYLQKGLLDSARSTVEPLLRADPDHPIARQIAGILDQAASAPKFESAALLPDLPDAPRLPDPEDIVPPGARLPMSGVFSVGTLVEGRYQLLERIGRGGTSAIFKALDTVLGEHIALKAFLQAVPDENMDRRIRRELKMARNLTHQNIVRVHELGSQQGFRYITMELLTGTDLRDKMRFDLPGAQSIDYLIQICDGLGAAHAQGIVHRDVKPENCFITTSEVLKLLDFGIAKVVAAPGATMSGAILGTPIYISPEQITDYSYVTHKADMYSLGVVAYEMFAGTPPFGPADPMALLRMHMEEIPRPPRSLVPAIPEALETTILRLLEKDPDRRQADFNELKAELASIRPLLI